LPAGSRINDRSIPDTVWEELEDNEIIPSIRHEYDTISHHLLLVKDAEVPDSGLYSCGFDKEQSEGLNLVVQRKFELHYRKIQMAFLIPAKGQNNEIIINN
jgi:hypothetical protein